ncbi:MAG: glycosyltransferase family 2 protein [Clostridiales Family XIII bacterium]|nr:glycosyltransferase family 2 protein [Clostridiales Family XIII bacterium]
MNEKILFFTCAYNAEKYLRRAMDSILNQTYSNWVYYVLDNGSTDGTGEIIRAYEKRDSRIQGLSVKRNDVNNLFYTPFRKNDILPDVDYDYMAVLDADDEYMPEFAYEALSFARANELDVVAVATESNMHPGVIIWGYGTDRIMVTSDYRDLPGWYKIINPVWGKLYHSSVINRFRKERVNTYDFEIVLEAFFHSERMGIIGMILHRYHQRHDSASRAWDSTGALTYRFQAVDYFNVLHRFMIEKCGDISKRSEDLIYYTYATATLYVIDILCGSELSGDSKRSTIEEMLVFDRTKQLIARENFGAKMKDQSICLEARRNLLKRIAYCVKGKNYVEQKTDNLLLPFYLSMIEAENAHADGTSGEAICAHLRKELLGAGRGET